MKSKKKLSQVKSFAKSKVKECREAIPAELNEIIDWSTVTLHMKNYTHDTYGTCLISVVYDFEAMDAQQLESKLEDISINNHIGMYVTVDEEMCQIYFFNKALNNHIRIFHLMAYEEDEFVRKCAKRLPHIQSKLLSDTRLMLEELKWTSDDVFVQLTNDLTDEFGKCEDYISLEGILKKVNDKEIVLESVCDAEYETIVKISENWKLCDIKHLQRKYEDIEIEL